MDLTSGVSWFRGSSVRIHRGGREIHVDPSGLTEEGPADYILLTHPHYDNFSEENIARVRGAGTTVIAPASMKKQLAEADHFLRPGDMLQLEGVDVLAVPAYTPEKKFHPQENGWLGYVFTLDRVTYYHAGDTDYLDSMATIRCDVAFLPCDGHYTMDADEAVRAAQACGAAVLVPVHWGESWGTGEDNVCGISFKARSTLFRAHCRPLHPSVPGAASPFARGPTRTEHVGRLAVHAVGRVHH